jgi:hypothetical protein
MTIDGTAFWHSYALKREFPQDAGWITNYIREAMEARAGGAGGGKNTGRLMGATQLGLQVQDVLTATAIAHIGDHFLGSGQMGTGLLRLALGKVDAGIL